MKLIRYGQPGNEKPGIIIDNIKYDIAAFGEDYNERFFETDGLSRLAEFISNNKNTLTRIDDNERLANPVARPSKIVNVGLNYKDHAHEMSQPLPTEPVVFLKATSALGGAFDDIIIPKDSLKTDWEIELTVIIGKKASYVSEANAMDYVAGYAMMNDVSERAYMFERNGTWDKGKGCDTFAPLGPWFVTKDEIADPHNLRLWLNVNGKPMQDGNTSDMIFNLPFLIAYISSFMTLLPGDIISTGSPSGVGKGQNPPVFLKPGDVIDLGIEGLGEARQHLKAYGEI